MTPQNGFNSDTAISVSGLPDGITATQATVSAGSGSTTIRVSETGSLASGTYSFLITGSGGGISRSASAAFTHVAKQAIGTVAVDGHPISLTFDPCPPMYSCPQTVWDNGLVSITVNGFTANASYAYPTDTTDTVISSLLTALNGPSSPVTAAQNGNVISITSRGTGPASNYSLSASSTFSSSTSGYTLNGQTFTFSFDRPAFIPTASGPNLTGGQ